MNNCENSKEFRSPRRAAILYNIDLNLIIAIHGFNTLGMSYIGSNSAAWLDNNGIGSLVGSAAVKNVMDLHMDIKTQERRNLLRLLYPNGLSLEQSMSIVSTLLSSMLSKLFCGHHRAHFDSKEDGQIAATSPAYNLYRAQHQRIFKTLETYTN
jgi:hypothetical protein